MYHYVVCYVVFYFGNVVGSCIGIAITGVWERDHYLEMIFFWSAVTLVGIWITLSYHSSASEWIRSICSHDNGAARSILQCCLFGWAVTFGASLSAVAAYHLCGWCLTFFITDHDLAIGAFALLLGNITWISIYYWSLYWAARLRKPREQRATTAIKMPSRNQDGEESCREE